MKIEIIKKENDENVYIIPEGMPEQKLVFETLKEISKLFLEKKRNNESYTYEVVTTYPELSLYKTTVENILKSILEDDELFNLYKENNEASINDENKSEISD